MKKEDRISLIFLVIFVLGLLNLTVNITAKLFSIFLTTAQVKILFLAVLLFTAAVILFSKKKMLKSKFYNYYKKQVMLFLQTFKEWKLLLNGVLIEVLTFLSAILIVFLAVKFLSWNFSFLGQIPGLVNAAQTGAPPGSALLQEMQKNAPGVRNAVIFSVTGVIAAYLLIILSIGFFQGLLYSKFTKQKFDKKFMQKFSILNLILMLSLTILAVSAAIMIKSRVAGYVIAFLLFLFFYLFLVLFSSFSREKKILIIAKSLLELAFKKIYLFFTPFIIAYTFIAILSLITGFLYAKLALLPLAAAIAYAFTFIIFITWLKFFITKVVRSIKNE